MSQGCVKSLTTNHCYRFSVFRPLPNDRVLKYKSTDFPLNAMSTNTPIKYHRPELLAPAGNWECAKAAVENGADAIYFGLDRFNARMRADNFTEADLPN